MSLGTAFTPPASRNIRMVETLPAPLPLYAHAMGGIFKRNRDVELPDVRLVRPRVTLDATHIERYARVCGFIPEQGVPLTYPHLLGFPLQLMLLTDPRFPWPALGLVHLANVIRQHNALRARDTLRIEVECGALLRHDKGQAFALHTRIYRGGEAVWDADSLYLKRGAACVGEALGALAPLDEHVRLEPRQRWQLDGGIGRRYADVSGDLNPIHLHALTARLFGFSRAIAHGMWTKARALAALAPSAPLVTATATAEFKLPLMLPGEAVLMSAADPADGFEVRDRQLTKPHLRGTFTFERETT
jgi:MaoC like domain